MTNTMCYTYAMRYGKTGFPCFPCCYPIDGHCACGRHHEDKNAGKVPLTPNGLKDATCDLKQIDKWWTEYPTANIGIAIPEGYFVLDVDINHQGYESLVKLEELIGELPETIQITTGSGGSHFWYKTKTQVKNTTQLAGLQGLDIRGIGGYVIAPPSIHRSGGMYVKSKTWNKAFGFAPQNLIDLCTSKEYKPLPDLPESFIEGQRNDRLASLAGTLRARGCTESTILISLMEINRQQCNPPLPDNEVKIIAKSYGRYPAGTIQPSFKSDWMKTSGKL